MIIRNARILTFADDNRVFEHGAVEVGADGNLGWVGEDRKLPQPKSSEEVIDADGKLLMPALINCHTHLYSSLARGIQLRRPAPRNFTEILKKLWWKLDTALEENDVYLGAMVGLIDSAKAGVATLFDHHSSPNACPGSLDVIERAFRKVGLRGCLCYETSDRNGPAAAQEAIAENLRFLERVGPASEEKTIAAIFGLHASFTLTDRTLKQCVAANCFGAGFHIHVAEDDVDVTHSRKHFGKTPVARLADVGVLQERSIAAHCVHVTKADIGRLYRSAVNVVHNPQSNCNNAVGIADLTEMMQNKVMVGLGSDGYSPRILDEFAAAFHLQKVRTQNPNVGRSEALTALLNNREIARRVCGWTIGAVKTGARADLMLVDYRPPTPLTPENLFGHILFGIARSPVDSLWVNGRPVLHNGHCVNIDEELIFETASARAQKLWSRI